MGAGGDGACAGVPLMIEYVRLTRLLRWQGSSIGRYYSSNWLGQMLGAANGIHPSTYFGTSKDSKVPAVIPKTDKLPIKILFPTESEILEGRRGMNARRLFQTTRSSRG